MSTTQTRRQFLKTGAAAGSAALTIGFSLTPAEGQEAPKAPPRPSPFDAWIRVDKQGQVTLKLAKSEMGQGVMTALPLILAEELDVDWASVKVEQAPTNPRIYRHLTGGSTSVRTQWLPLRQAAAAAREMLTQAAAQAWGVAAADCRSEAGAVLLKAGGKRAPYGELVEAAAKLPLPELDKLALKPASAFKLIGRDVPRVDLPSKVDGSAIFGFDVRVPGLLYAVIARCPTFGGKPRSFDAAAAKAVKGVKHVLEIPPFTPGAFAPGGIAVVAESTWAAVKGREALKVDWDRGATASESSASLRAQFEGLLKQPGKLVRDEGQVEQALAGGKRVEALYELPFVAHATMEPLNATVHVKADSAEAWLATQAPDWNLDVIARATGLPHEKVTVHTLLLGGGFGRRAHADFAAEAALVSKATGAPVQVVWTREDDIQHDFYRPASLHSLRGSVDGGKATAWHHRMTSTAIAAQWEPPEHGKPEESEIGGAVNLPYAIPNLRMEYALAKTGVPVMWWRSVEHSVTAFVTECFLDELAAAAGQDPLAFRLALLAEPRLVKIPPEEQAVLETRRLKGVLELAAAKAGWGAPAPAGRARGIAAHFSFWSYVAQVAEVSVKNGTPRVHRVVCAVDCGRVVQPDGVRAQVESAVVYGLSAALKGAITIAGGAVEQSNFHDFEVLRIDEMPEVEVHLVESDAPPTGIGEPGLPPIAPAVANALYALTGKRLRRLPIRAADLA